MLDIEKSIKNNFPKTQNLPNIIQKGFFFTLKKLMLEDELNKFLENNKSSSIDEFLENVFDKLNFSYKLNMKELENIPVDSKVIIIANHPLGALDALSLIHMIRKVRKDVKIVANKLLNEIEPLKEILIPTDVFNNKIPKESLNKIYESLKKEEALIFFPAAEVSRVSINGIKDGKWKKGFLKIAIKTNTPILPIYINAKNSFLFYTTSVINKNISTLLLPKEIFKKKNSEIEFKIGEIIPIKSLEDKKINTKTKVKLLKKHLYILPKNKKIFKTQSPISHPENKKNIKTELNNAEILGKTNDGKVIYLFKYFKDSSVMKEVGRLREISFRRVEEGTGKKRDLDSFDKYYSHIILWDDDELEIVGAYRLAKTKDIYKKYGFEGFYSNTLFRFQKEFAKYMPYSLELGRSFIQPKYWGSRALDYLWQGIGAYLKNNPDIKYIFGPVSLSSAYPKFAQNLIIYYYQKHYFLNSNLVKAINPFLMSENELNEVKNILNNNKKEDFITLKDYLSQFSLSVPTLYKQYTNLTEKGTFFLDFNIDEDFNNAIDGFILTDIEKITPRNKKRYLS